MGFLVYNYPDQERKKVTATWFIILKFILFGFGAVSLFSSSSSQIIISNNITTKLEMLPPVVLTVKGKIVKYAKEFGTDANLAIAVAYAESCFEPTAKNKNSSASGIFQFVQQTWEENCEGDVFNEDDNIKCGVKMLAKKENLKHWEASRKEGCEGGWEEHLKTKTDT